MENHEKEHTTIKRRFLWVLHSKIVRQKLI